MRLLLLSFVISIFPVYVYSARPTNQPTNFTASQLRCNSVQLNWVAGNGYGRVIIGRKGGSVSYTPQDNTVYAANPNFGTSANYGNDNFVVYNGNSSSSVVISGLESGETYYFNIFEHDLNGNSTEYLVTNSPGLNAVAHFIDWDVVIIAIDSCERNNRYRFINNSTSSIPGIVYTWTLGDSFNSTSPDFFHSYNLPPQINPVNNVLRATPSLGCIDKVIQKNIIYRKRNVNFQLGLTKPVQCLVGNFFDIGNYPVVPAVNVPSYYNFKWDFGDNTFSNMPHAKKTYTKPGTYIAFVEVTTMVNGSPTGCRDTAAFEFKVNPVPEVNLGPDTGFLKDDTINMMLNAGNNFVEYLWSTNETTATITIDKAGVFWVRVTDSFGCIGSDTIEISNTSPQVNIGSDHILNPFLPVNLVLNAGSGFKSYLWSTSETSSTIVVMDTGTYWVQVKDRFGLSASDTVKVRFWNSTDLNNKRMEFKFHFYPNPADNFVELSNPEWIKIELYDLIGNLMHQTEFNNGIVTLNTTYLLNGLYFLQVSSAGKTQRFKLQVQH